MIVNPIIPVWVMTILCIFFLVLKRKGRGNYIRQIFIVILLFMINMRIMVLDDELPTVMPKADVVFVVDNTISMLAEDYNGDGRRIDAVKNDCQYITEQFPGASFSVVTFGETLQRLIPYTVDANMVVETIGMLHGQSKYYAHGTSLNDVMNGIQQILDDDRENYKILFFISDGEIMNSEELKSHEGLDKYVDSGAVLGYGTKEGGPMKTVEYWEEEETDYLYYYDEDFEEKLAISKIDEENLKSIAEDFGISYVHMTSQSEINDVIKNLQAQVNELDIIDDMDSKEGYADIYYLFVIPLVLLLMAEFICYKKKIYRRESL